MLKFVLLFILILSETVVAEINLNRFRKSNSTFSSFNRDNALRYRGVGPELTPKQAVRAMLGDKAGSMKSMYTEALRYLLMGKTITDMPFSSMISGYIDSNTIVKVTEKIKENNDRPYGYREACLVASELSREIFKSKYSNSDIVNYFINYDSGYYMDFPNDPREVVFSTVYMEVAANYSSHVVVIDEKKEKSIDLNFFNYIKNGRWIRKMKPWPDKGEFITAVEVPAEDITGYEIRGNFVKDFATFAPVGNNLKIAFYKVTYNKKDYILAIDGKNMPGVYKDGDKFSYAISQINPVEDVPSYITSSGTNVEVLGIVGLCSKKENCVAPKKLFKKYNISKSGIPTYYEKQILKVDFKGKRAKIFYHPIDIPGDAAISTDEPARPKVAAPKSDSAIEVLKALAVADQENDKYLHPRDYISKGKKTKNAIEFSFDNEISLEPGDAYYFAIPKEYWTREVESVELHHRKADKDHYATISSQFLVDSEWRVSGTQGRKGKTDSPVGPTMITVSKSSIDGWGAGEHWGFPRGSKVGTPVKGTAFRVISIGKQKNWIKNIKINFK